MSSIFVLLFIFLQKYLVPFLFSIGLFHFFYGLIEYFVIGKGGDEDRLEHGRQLFLKSIGWFLLALIVHLIVMAIGWFFTSNIFLDIKSPTLNSGFNLNDNEAVLQVPNVPARD